ncbi:unnamed protein product [Periconia digitata]|uniref:Uncharacterized protein n=1 Tax=Periconia digitata TaxID=1303443 RepID=A0A9W4U6U4_9PLEO|nr:unnamed protein product [Periconia digitata]
MGSTRSNPCQDRGASGSSRSGALYPGIPAITSFTADVIAATASLYKLESVISKVKIPFHPSLMGISISPRNLTVSACTAWPAQLGRIRGTILSSNHLSVLSKKQLARTCSNCSRLF